MSFPHHAQRTSSPFGNPFRMIRPKGPLLSQKLLTLQTSFELTLAESLRKLKPKKSSDVLSFSWMRNALEILSEVHNNIKTLTTALQFPASEWDSKCLDMYLDNSVKLLDICNALTSEFSRLDQSQLFLKYALHILASIGTSPSFEQLNRLHSSLHDWTEQNQLRSRKLENCSPILQCLTSTLQVPKVKNSAKGEVLVRALYSVKVVTIFICRVITAALLGCEKPLKDLHVCGDFLWTEAFNDLQTAVNGEIKNLFFLGRSGLKELDAVNLCVESLHALSTGFGHVEEEKPNVDTKTEKILNESWKETALDLAKNAECLTHELDLLSKQLENFFHLVLAGRNTLLSSLRTPDVQLKGNSVKCR